MLLKNVHNFFQNGVRFCHCMYSLRIPIPIEVIPAPLKHNSDMKSYISKIILWTFQVTCNILAEGAYRIGRTKQKPDFFMV